ncbi:MAG: hypothetical protein F4213_06490 [Boseongicola sp. SB0677_bin_26]|nr:hypothetical protein [Boseongicola sp. SB0665_bin_10]MYG25658.1 hypothetical protein [Boseongicola sp. SB0677_bin_26]
MITVSRAGLAVGLALAMVPHEGTSQAPFDFDPEEARDTLGPCPTTILRRIWGTLEGSEAAAVEQEVLKLCTERARVINEFINAQIELNVSLDRMNSPDLGRIKRDEAISQERIAELRDNLRDMDERIRVLESGEGPSMADNESELAQLKRSAQETRDELTRLEGERDILASAEAEVALDQDVDLADNAGVPGLDRANPNPDNAVTARMDDIQRRLDSAFVKAAEDAAATTGKPAITSEAETLPAVNAAKAMQDLLAAALATEPAEEDVGVPLGAATAMTRPTEERRWKPLAAVRAAGRPWQVRIESETRWTWNAAVSEAGEAEPRTVVEPGVSLTLMVGDRLPDGRRLVRIDDSGIWLLRPRTDSGTREGEPTGLADLAGALTSDLDILGEVSLHEAVMDDGASVDGVVSEEVPVPLMQDVTRILEADLDELGGTPEEQALRRQHLEGFKAALGSVAGMPPMSLDVARALAQAGSPGPWNEVLAVLEDMERAKDTSSLDFLPFPAPADASPGISEWNFTIITPVLGDNES